MLVDTEATLVSIAYMTRKHEFAVFQCFLQFLDNKTTPKIISVERTLTLGKIFQSAVHKIVINPEVKVRFITNQLEQKVGVSKVFGVALEWESNLSE